jgi:hypothetical protein
MKHSSKDLSIDKLNATNMKDYHCIFDGLSTLPQLVFELHNEVFDVKFFLELLEYHLTLATNFNTTQEALPYPATDGAMVATLIPPG